MKNYLLSITLLLFSAFVPPQQPIGVSIKMPFKKMGLSPQQAASHLLSRMSFGATPQQINEVVSMGLDNWMAQQLDDKPLPDQNLTTRLADYDALNFTNEQIINTFPRPAALLKLAQKQGIISKDTLDKDNKKAYREQIASLMKDKGLRPLKELKRQLINQKILRAAYANNQLKEVLTDFWFNHFNVYLEKNQCSPYILTYERDAIRPNVLGNFDALLEATAKHPAMLLYLDNALSVVNQEDSEMMADKPFRPKGRKNQGLNENYGREIMELHTLGVDGGYTQADVTAVARAFTGWTLYPRGDYGPGKVIEKLIERVGWDKLKQRGFVQEGDFLFRANQHDQDEKLILGQTFEAGGGYNEGMKVIQILSHHAATAQHICSKLAQRFVSDNPPKSLIDKMIKVFLSNNGNTKALMICMVESPEFWSKEALREKIKSPFELAISAIRATGAEVNYPYRVYEWIAKMGQPTYGYQAPTGFPDRADYWINTGALLNRMNFGLAFTGNRIQGLKVDLAALNQHHEPESSDQALEIYAKLLLPQRDLDSTIKRLKALINDNAISQKIQSASDANKPNPSMMTDDDPADKPAVVEPKPNNPNLLAQVVGIILGSPEFQRR